MSSKDKECNNIKKEVLKGKEYDIKESNEDGGFIFCFENRIRGALGRDAPGAEVRLQYPRQHSTECGKIPHNTIISIEKK